MATWTGTGAHNANYTGTLTVTEDSYNVAGNTSTLSYSLVITGNSGYYYQDIATASQISINGSLVQDRSEQITMPVPSGGVSTKTICSGTVVVPHNADGTKTVTVWATITTPSTQYYLPGEIKMPSGLNGSLTLTTIPRESSMTVPSLTIGSSGTFTISANSSTFTHSITYTFGNLSGTAATAAAGVTSVSWTPPNTFYNEMPYSTSGYVSLVLHTYSGGTEIGSKSYTGTVYVPDSIKPTAPTVTLTPVNTNAWLNSKGLYVGGYSKVKIDSSASPGTGSYISGYTITNSVTGSGASYTSGVLDAGSKTISVTVADTRGRTNFTTVYVHFQEYANPQFTTFKAVRGTYSNGSWTSNEYGNHIRVQAVGSVSLSESGNTGTKTVKIGNTSPNYTSGNYYYFTGTDAVTSYTISGSITDSVGNTATKSVTVSANPAASTLSIPSLTIGSSATLTVTPVSNTLSHKITYSFSGLSGTIATLAAGTTTASWTPPTTFYAKLPNATSGTVSIVLKTYSGATETGSKSYNATVNVGSSIKPTVPTVTVTPVNTNAWINSKSIYVAGYTKIKVQSSATAGTGASISAYTISGAISGTGASYTSGVISSSGNKSITVTATDTRDRSNYKSTSVTYLAYSAPSLTTFKATRGTYSGGSWTSNTSGDHIRVQAVGSVSLSANGNTGTITVKTGNTNPDATSGNYYYFTSTNATTPYTFTGTITDSVGNTTTKTLTVPTIEVPLNIDVDLPSVGVGMIAQNAKQLDINPSWRVSPHVITKDQYYTQGNYGINMSNSDLVSPNGIYFTDTANASGEGVNFIRSNNNWDTIYALDGSAYIQSNHALGSTASAARFITEAEVKDWTTTYTDGTYMQRRFWNRGFAEFWANATLSVTSWSAKGAVYRAEQSRLQSYPAGMFEEYTRPVIVVSAMSRTIAVIGTQLYDTDGDWHTHAPRVYPISYANSNTGDVSLNYYAYGMHFAKKNYAPPIGDGISEDGITSSTYWLTGRTSFSGTRGTGGGQLTFKSAPFTLPAGYYRIDVAQTSGQACAQVYLLDSNGNALQYVTMGAATGTYSAEITTGQEYANCTIGARFASNTAYNGTIKVRLYNP